MRGICSIPAGLPFVDVLAAGLMRMAGEKPEELAAITLLLPTRRACRAMREAFLRHSGGRPLLLPRMMPLGDLDEDELALADWGEGLGLDPTLPPALSGLKRQLMLARLVMAFEGGAFEGGRASPEQAVGLASELAGLLDQMRTERLDFSGLKNLAPDDLADHWQKVLDFLDIIGRAWPEVLAEAGAMDAAERRNRLLEAQAALWRSRPPSAPVIAAGSTGSLPATAELLACIKDLPQGLVVLPGLDRHLDDESWLRLEPGHPQFGMARLLERLETGREAVPDWPGAEPPGPIRARVELLAEALRPAATTHRWARAEPAAEGLDGLSLLEAPTPREEAAAIAIALRSILEIPERRAALITPDRSLARRVAVELERFGVKVDCSAGTPLDETHQGAFMLLAVEAVVAGLAPVPLLSLLKHPLTAAGIDPARLRSLVRRLELDSLRGPRPAPGFAGLARALDEGGGDPYPWLARLEEAARPLCRLLDLERAELADLLAAHVAWIEYLAASDAIPGPERLWAGEAGEALSDFVAEAMEAATGFPPLRGRDYPGMIREMMRGRVVRPVWGRHPRLFIWGPLEARLQQVDLAVLGGLNEGKWPPEVRPGPWMSRPMQRKFGLPLPERRIGLSAHDFASAAAAGRVLLTRSLRVDGTPQLPSRWLARLDNLLRGRGLALPRARHWLEWAEALDDVEKPAPVPPPRPTPPLEARPDSLSVTRVETWIRDPYAIFARDILGLSPLDPLDQDPGAAEKGSVIHKALEDFLKKCPDDLPENAIDILMDCGRLAFGETLGRPGVRAFWWPRFKRIAAWFVDWEKARRAAGIRPVGIEISGRLEFPVQGLPFVLTAKADRIDRLPGGGLAVIDYKTGQPPTPPMVKTGLSPQLTLEGAMLMEEDTFPGILGRPECLLYLRLSGGRQAGEEKSMVEEVPAMCLEAMEGLRRRIAAYRNPETPYLSRPRPQFIGRHNDYDHLARVAEWSVQGGEED